MASATVTWMPSLSMLGREVVAAAGMAGWMAGEHRARFGFLAELHALCASGDLFAEFLVLRRRVRVVGVGHRGRADGRGVRLVRTPLGHSTHAATAPRAHLLALHFELLRFSLALLRGLELFVARDDLLDALLVAFHIEEGLDLAHG